MKDALIIYCVNNSARFQYIVSWIFKEQLQLDYTITDKEADIASLPFFISYGRSFENALVIPDAGLLWEKGIKEQNIKTDSWDELPVLFFQPNKSSTLPFDIFSAIFFLLSRYEEYYAYTPDKHGRYPPTESILFKQGILKRPVIDEWLKYFSDLLRDRYGIKTAERKFSYLPTYDIDIAYEVKGKTPARNIGAAARSLGSGSIKDMAARLSVMAGAQNDPYDTYEEIFRWHRELGVKPLIFILAALSTTAFDKNINPREPVMQNLVKQLDAHSTIGLHPSYYATTSETLTKEKHTLENISGNPITISRQHYIKSVLPGTYRLLIECGIATDYSMGYGTHLGFRSGTGRSFLWYDLEHEKITALRVHPFCFMDTAALFYEKLNSETAFAELAAMAEALKKVGSELITIFHNSTFSKEPQWRGWKEQYELLLKKFCAPIS